MTKLVEQCPMFCVPQLGRPPSLAVVAPGATKTLARSAGPLLFPAWAPRGASTYAFVYFARTLVVPFIWSQPPSELFLAP